MSSLVFKIKVYTFHKKVQFKKRKISLMGLRKENFMEQQNINKLKIVKLVEVFIRHFFADISERSQMFYHKYLRSTVNYDSLEVKRIRDNSIENILWDTIRNQ
jgi:hypothetical protein